MAGLFGSTHPYLQLLDIEKYANRLKHTPRIQYKLLPSSFTPSLGVVYFEQNPEEAVFIENELCAIVLCGIAYQGKKRCTVENLLHFFCTQGLQTLWDLDGTYTIAVKDKQANLVTIFTDPYCTQNVYYTHTNGIFSFAPEAKLLFPLSGLKPRVSVDGVMQILNNKYTFGETTMFEEVKQLEAGVALQYHLNGNCFKTVRYWDLVFDYSKMSLKDAVNLVRQEVLEAHQIHFQDITPKDKYYLFLTGGLDSRANLAIASQIHQKPTKTLSWGVREDIPQSDPFIARQLSNLAGVEFQFCQYDESTFLNHVKKWLYISELRSFNMGSFAAGELYFAQQGVDDGKFVVIGDHIFGAGGYAENVNDAIYHTVRVPKNFLLPQLEGLFIHEAKEELVKQYQTKLFQVINNCKNTNFKDIQDYLNFHVVTTRWLFAPGNFKDPVLPVRRPFMLKNVIQLVQQLPPFLRIDKKAFYQMMKVTFPMYMKIPFQAADSIIDWKTAIIKNQSIQEYLKFYLNREHLKLTPIGTMINYPRFQNFIETYFRVKKNEGSTKYTRMRLLYDLRKMVTVNPLLGKMAKIAEPIVVKLTRFKTSETENNPSELILKVALISIFSELVNNGTFETGWQNTTLLEE
ncbi:MAG: hypothetical protein N2450_06085 [bacterium]|nr:hypothetical protein [bacterium]